MKNSIYYKAFCKRYTKIYTITIICNILLFLVFCWMFAEIYKYCPGLTTQIFVSITMFLFVKFVFFPPIENMLRLSKFEIEDAVITDIYLKPMLKCNNDLVTGKRFSYEIMKDGEKYLAYAINEDGKINYNQKFKIDDKIHVIRNQDEKTSFIF